jgi:hypothetical protein
MTIGLIDVIIITLTFELQKNRPMYKDYRIKEKGNYIIEIVHY